MDEKIDGKIKIERTREKERGREEAKEKIRICTSINSFPIVKLHGRGYR